MLRAIPRSRDSELVRRWKGAGALIVGKTNTPELALQATTEPEAFGPTRSCAMVVNRWHRRGGKAATRNSKRADQRVILAVFKRISRALLVDVFGFVRLMTPSYEDLVSLRETHADHNLRTANCHRSRGSTDERAAARLL
ncbi:MAG: hypothetical protein HXY37_06890 [Chloroflexi bacterium]|nr:hypothetical protein [Chloroflexota bacterium]